MRRFLRVNSSGNFPFSWLISLQPCVTRHKCHSPVRYFDESTNCASPINLKNVRDAPIYFTFPCGCLNRRRKSIFDSSVCRRFFSLFLLLTVKKFPWWKIIWKLNAVWVSALCDFNDCKTGSILADEIRNKTGIKIWFIILIEVNKLQNPMTSIVEVTNVVPDIRLIFY